ncbi:TetR family transcriptional regulator (plasmid) [Rhizobium leguminosarum bv. viciae 248]|uniref:TetR/AcrR family transcriptional regulator n=1 Tax=Rhizobium leguminosarum TaxID=384 RepID=UPI00038017E1|nr:TetR family transcriptional regulator [Rhizobium leguminosarum]MCA2406284.1 TetR/AcrR family transcriptional regulator [Rhizobium leguminosarum]NKM59748.1 TetR family transcriptional regulator [Rhizobium leguminosarum bv. viciae]QHW27701.1 TetR family transcriptional regulator [Rhizobium leguminosarum bv. viciae 248]
MSRRTPREIDVDLSRERILDVAEKHFRRIGYQKASVADIASCLGMSTANIYRFFPSRAVINRSICGRFLAETVQFAESIAQMQAPSSEKLANLLTDFHRKRKTTAIKEKPVHELIVTATAENWVIARAHSDQISAIETIVREGVEAHEFGVEDAAQAARNVMSAFMPFYHPVLVEQRVRNGEDTEAGLRDQIPFIMKALGCSV